MDPYSLHHIIHFVAHAISLSLFASEAACSEAKRNQRAQFPCFAELSLHTASAFQCV
jgi:hypothetical protein